ncbi:DUF6843 domain-containing protein [Paenibacillus sp. Root444D2]|uniref:DUF6843 domain-containing protein n=1 Tax=Paenibacillus sp. Root444D2 TaxID=1736538 RepID=UPI0007095B5B|nr:hypothetical protein [Paenibacillus sp. Root444D2]KQX62631.1 hypothetical protein ASD40_29795 [Paenibacillus sp. Root444D2]
MINKARLSNLIIPFFIAIVTISIVVGGIILLNITEGTTHKFLLPKGFTGWVEITYEQPGFPALKKEDRTFIYKVPPSGKLMTASKNVSGTMVLIYVEQDGRLIDLPTDVPMIHGQGTSGGGQGGPHGQTEKFPDKLTFFVGTEEQWREAMEKQPAL